MGLFQGKKGIIMGVVNEFSIAAGIAKSLAEQGATIGLSYLPDKSPHERMRKRVQKVGHALGVEFIRPCDVTIDADIDNFFAQVHEHFGMIDFLVHSIAFAPIDDIRRPTLEVTREGFKTAMDISVYSFIAVAGAASKMMPAGSSMLTLSYIGGEKVVGGYNLMGVCKSALEMTTRYLAHDLGPKHIRVNAVSSGPIQTLAASAVGDFTDMLHLNAAVAPMGRNVSSEEVGKTAIYLLSDLSSATTGEILHVDCGYHIMGSPGYALKRLGLEEQRH